MTLEIHPSAASNFDTKAAALVSLIKEIPVNPPPQPEFPSDVHTLVIKETDILSFTQETMTDYRGRTVARFFPFDKGHYGLDSNDYAKAIEVGERMQSLAGLSSKLSTSFIETSLFTWLRKSFEGEEVNPSFTAFLLAHADEAVETITLWTPVDYLEIEVPIPVSRSELRPLSKSVIDGWEQKAIALSSDKDKDKVVAVFDELRKNCQGLAAVVTRVEAEPRRAIEFAREEAERITSVLAMFSAATGAPDIKCVSTIKGSDNSGVGTTILEFEADGLHITNEVMDRSAKFWRLTKKELADFRLVLLDKVSRLLAAESLNGFEKAVLNSILLYSKASFTSDPVEKLVYMLSSLESILLKNENEPILQNLAERLAIFTERELEARKKIIKTIKSVYGIRSKYLHHGHTHSELALMKEFMFYVWMFFVKLVAHVERFGTKEEFVGAIDDHKLG